MTALFVAATDTGAGKTMVTGLLAAYCAARGVDVVTQKWVQTGARRGGNDLDLHLRLTGQRPLTAAVRALREPYALPLPASPHLAARTTGITIQPARILAAYRALAPSRSPVASTNTTPPCWPPTTSAGCPTSKIV